jgi:phage-related tail fiber protein
MANKYYSILTDVGVAAVANAAALGRKVDIQYVAVGDGGGAYYQPASDAEALKHEVWRGNVSSIKLQSSNIIEVTGVITSDVGGFTIRETGLFNSLNQLIAISNVPDTNKVVIADGTASEMILKQQIAVSNTDVINLKMDPTIILATKQDLISKADLKDGKVVTDQLPVASTEALGVVKLSKDFTVNEDGTISVKNSGSGTGSVPIKINEDRVTAELEFPVKFNEFGEVVATNEDDGTGIISLESVGGKLEFVAKNVI